MKNKKTSVLLAISVLLVFIAIFIFSSQTGEKSGNISQNFTGKFLCFFGLTDSRINHAEHILRKCAHVVEFALLGALICMLAFRIPKIRDSCYLAMAFSLAFTVIYAVTDEIHQAFVPGRGPSVWDVLLDGVGALIGISVTMAVRFFILHKRKNKSRNTH